MAKLKEYIYLIFDIIFIITIFLLFVRNCGLEGEVTTSNSIVEQLTTQTAELSRRNQKLADLNTDLESANQRLDYAVRRESEINKRQAETIERLQTVGDELQKLGDGLQGIGKEIYDDIEAAKKIVQECLAD